MSSPRDIINSRYGDIFVYFSENLKINSQESNSPAGQIFSVYSTFLDVGTITPVTLIALSKTTGGKDVIKLKDLNWSSIHIRSYGSLEDMERAGVNIKTNNPQKPTKNALRKVEDIEMEAISEEETSKTYLFEDTTLGRVTLFTSKSFVSGTSNSLPRKTTFVPWILDNNFVLEV